MERQDTLKLKGLAITLIVFYHLQYTLFDGVFMPNSDQGFASWFGQVFSYLADKPFYFWGAIFAFGYIGVHIFLILSGFGLIKKFLSYEKITLKQWWKQVWKLLLPYFIALPITHIINYGLHVVQFLLGKAISIPAFFDIYKLEQYWQSILVPTRWLNQELAFNFVGTWWFVGTIIQFYILFPFLLRLMKKIGFNKFLGLSIAISLLYRLVIVLISTDAPIGIYQAPALLFINFLARLPEFSLGMYFATKSSWYLFKKQFLAGLALTVLGICLVPFTWGTIFSDSIIAVGLLLTFNDILKFLKGFTGRISQWIGAKAYYIFLYHEPALGIIIRMIMSVPL